MCVLGCRGWRGWVVRKSTTDDGRRARSASASWVRALREVHSELDESTALRHFLDEDLCYISSNIREPSSNARALTRESRRARLRRGESVAGCVPVAAARAENIDPKEAKSVWLAAAVQHSRGRIGAMPRSA